MLRTKRRIYVRGWSRFKEWLRWAEPAEIGFVITVPLLMVCLWLLSAHDCWRTPAF